MSILRDRALVRAFRDLDVAIDWTPAMRAALARAERVALALEGPGPGEPVRVEALALGRRSLVTPGQSCETHGQVLALVDGEDRPRFVAAERVLDAAPAPAGAPPPPPNDQTPPAAASGPQTGASAPEETDRWP